MADLRQPSYTGPILEQALNLSGRINPTDYGFTPTANPNTTAGPALSTWHNGMTFFKGFGYYDPKTGQYFQDENQYNDWKARDAARTQNSNANDAALVQSWGMPAGTDPWKAAGSHLQQQYNSPNFSLSQPSTTTTTPPPTTNTNTLLPNPGGTNTQSQGFLPDYYRTAENPWTKRAGSNNPNYSMNTNQNFFGEQKRQNFGQMSYLMGNV